MQSVDYPAYEKESNPKAVMTSFLDWLIFNFSLQKDRFALWLPVFFACGIGLYFSLRFEPPFISSIPFIMAGAFGTGLLWNNRNSKTIFYTAWLMSCILLTMSSGFLAAQIRTDAVKMPVLEKETGPVEVIGIIKTIERLEGGKGNRIILKKTDIENLPDRKTPDRVRIKLHSGDNLKVGDKVTMLAGLNPPSAPVAPGAFDFQRYAYFEKIGAFGFAYRNPEIIEESDLSFFISSFSKLRQNIMLRIENALPYPEASFAITMLTGQRSTITEDDWEAMRSAGLAHMLAISGLHVGLIAGVLFFFSRLVMAAFPKLALRHPIKKYAALIAFSGALGYTLLVGGSIPTQRALIMTGIALLAIVLDREAISLRLAAIAAFVVLFMTPEALLGAGFQMSFAAVIGLIAFYEAIRPYWSKWYSRAGWFRRILLYFMGVCMTTVIATIATAPFSIYHFQHLAPFSLPANLVAVPIMGFIVMPAVVLSLILMPFGLEWVGLKIMGGGISAILEIAHDVAELPGAALLIPVWPVSAFLLIVGSALFLVLWKGHLRFMVLAPFVVSLFIIYQYKQPDIIISSSIELAIVRSHDTKVYISSRMHDRFTADVISRRFGKENEEVIKFPLEGRLYNKDLITCGEHGCRINKSGQKIALSYDEYAHKNDCIWADILISKNPISNWNCKANIVIDKFDFWKNGAYALWIDTNSNHVRVENVAQLRGKRPWTGNNRR